MIIDSEGRVIGETVSFDDVLLQPKYSEIESRNQIDISSYLDEYTCLRLPVMSSPMDTVTETEMATAVSSSGGIGVVHRYNTIEEQVALAKKVKGHVACAVGVTGDYEARAASLVEAGCRILCLDVAHGHHALVRTALKTLREELGDKVHLMAGNVATLEAFNDLADWGADSIRVGIGGGSICSTRLNTGHGVPTYQSIVDCARSDRDAKLIADGGIKNAGDIVKALAAGADFVMLGSMLAGTDESPGEIFTSENKKYKVYRGMASRSAQMEWRGKSSSPEGVSTTIPYKGSVVDILQDITGNIKSGFSYTGATSLEILQSKATFIRQTPAGQLESSTHILRR
jgi:IMP dehydrogenase